MNTWKANVRPLLCGLLMLVLASGAGGCAVSPESSPEQAVCSDPAIGMEIRCDQSAADDGDWQTAPDADNKADTMRVQHSTLPGTELIQQWERRDGLPWHRIVAYIRSSSRGGDSQLVMETDGGVLVVVKEGDVMPGTDFVFLRLESDSRLSLAVDPDSEVPKYTSGTLTLYFARLR